MDHAQAAELPNGRQPPCKLVIAEQHGWISAKVQTLRTRICVTHGPEKPDAATFKIVSAPHMTPHMVSIGH